MEIKDIEKALSEALQAPEDEEARNKYRTAIEDYLKGKNSSEEIVSIVIRGIELDRAADYFDFLAGASEKELESIWKKQIHQRKVLKEGKKTHLLMFFSGMLRMAFMKEGHMEILCGSIITAMVEMISEKKSPLPVKTYEPIICDFFLDDLDPKSTLPGWETIKTTDKNSQHFARILLGTTEGKKAEQYNKVRIWATMGLRYTEKRIKEKEIEAKIPKSRIEDLTAIVDHYKAVEKQLRDGAYEKARLQDVIEGLHQDIDALQGEKRALEDQIRMLTADMAEKQQQLDKAVKEAGERAAINEAFGALKKNDESALLQDIANELKAEYQDFVDSISDQMDKDLGEIYREKLKNIFRILDKKGIKMG